MINLQIKANRRALDEAVFTACKAGKKSAPIAMVDIVESLPPEFDGVTTVNIRMSLGRLAAAKLIGKIGKGPSTRYHGTSKRKALPSTWGERG